MDIIDLLNWCDCKKSINIKIPPLKNMATAIGTPKSNDSDDSLFTDNDDKLLMLFDELNEFANSLNSYKQIDQDITNSPDLELNIPRIVMVGAQSSGKSSFVNRLIGYEIMPTGHNMVTKTPVYVRLYHTKNGNDYVTISTSDSENQNVLANINLEAGDSKELMLNEFKRATFSIVGKSDNISSKPIYINVYSKNVLNLTLVDLPGIILVAKTDKGQSRYLVDDIKKLIETEVSKKNTYVVVCAEAKPDLETDIGLSTYKEFKIANPQIKAVTLFTKVDMLEGARLSQFEHILNDGLSKDLKTDDGYYCISSIYDDPIWYSNFFGKKSVIAKNMSYGIVNFFLFLKKKILANMRKLLFNTKGDLEKCIIKLKDINPMLAEGLITNSDKTTYISHNIYILGRAISNSFNSTGFELNIGSKFKETFNEFSRDITKLDPFVDLTQEKLIRIVESFNGYLSSNNVMVVMVINKCLADPELKPIVLINDCVKKCTEKIGKMIIELVKTFLKKEKLDIHQLELNSFSVPVFKFPNLETFIIKITEQLVESYTKKTLEIIKNHLDVQQQEIWVRKKDLDKKYNTTYSISSKINLLTTKPIDDEKLDKDKPEENNDDNQSTSSDDIINDTNMDYDKFTKTPLVNKNDYLAITDFAIGANIENSISDAKYVIQMCYKHTVKTTKILTIKTIIMALIKKFENHFFLEVIKQINNINNNNTFFYSDDESAIKNSQLELLIKKATYLKNKVYNFGT